MDIEAKLAEAYDLREEKRACSRKEAEIKVRLDAVLAEIADALEDQGLKKAGSGERTISVSYEDVPNVEPEYWPDVITWAVDNQFQQLLIRRLNGGAYRELKEMGMEIPHVTPYSRRKISLR